MWFSLLGTLLSRNATKAIKDLHIEDVEITDEDIARMRDDDDCSDSAPIEGEVG